MAADANRARGDAQRYYEDFSFAVGLRDWLTPNPRHEQLKLHVAGLLHGRRNLRILDVGCGAGVMTAYLRRFGTVTGLDFSTAAIDLARKLAPRVTFVAGSLEALRTGDRFDVIALFDVVEHIPLDERPQFLADVRDRLRDPGTVFISTPFPAFTRHRRLTGDETLQIVDEEVALPQLVAEAADVGLQLIEYRAFDVFRGSPEYQMMIFHPETSPGGPPLLRAPRLDGRMRLLALPGVARARRVLHAVRLAGRGGLREAWWMLTGKPPDVRS